MLYITQAGATPLHDVLAIMSVVHPELLRDVRPVHVDVETRGELTVGRTVMDVQRRGGKNTNTRVAFAADGSLFVRLLFDTFKRARASIRMIGQPSEEQHEAGTDCERGHGARCE